MIFSYYYPTFSVLKNQIYKIMQNLLKFKEYYLVRDHFVFLNNKNIEI
jgi:hypothetical protein